MQVVAEDVPWPRHASARIESWQTIHEKLVGLAKRRAGHDFEEGQWLLRGMRAGVHTALAYGSYSEYVERIFGYAPKVAADRIRVARALEELEATAEALREGDISWSIARELTRVAVAETESEWLDAVRSKTVRQVERMVSGRAPGDRPIDPPDESARRHVVRFEVAGDVLALLREAKGELVRRTGGHLEDDDVVRQLAEAVLSGARDEGKAAYQIAMTICAQCGAGKQEGGGDPIPVSDVVVERARCDAQHIGSVTGQPGRRVRASQTIPPAVRREVVRRHGGRCAVPGCCNTIVQVHHLDRRADGGTHDPRRLLPLCSAHHAAEHEGRLIIEGDAVSGFRFFHADRTPYGGTVAPGTTTAWGDAFSALKNLGHREGEIRSALERVRPTLNAEADAQTIVRAVLRELARYRASERKPATPSETQPREASSTKPPSPAPRGATSTLRVPDAAREARSTEPPSPAPRGRTSTRRPPDAPRGPSPTRRPSDAPRGPSPVPADESPVGLARGALVKVGFSRQDAHDAVDRAHAELGREPELEPLIRAALRRAVPPPGRARDGETLYRVERKHAPRAASSRCLTMRNAMLRNSCSTSSFILRWQKAGCAETESATHHIASVRANRALE